MLEAVLSDLLDLNINEITITRDSRLPDIEKPIRTINASGDIWQQWQDIMDEHSFAIIIAPEENYTLYRLTTMAEQTSCKLLGCTANAVKLASSKLATIEFLSRYSIPCVPSTLVHNNQDYQGDKWIIKPDDGAGGEGCVYFDNRGKLTEYIHQLPPGKTHIIQPCITGKSGSISLLSMDGECRVIGCNEQLFEFDQGKGKLNGIIINGLIDHLPELKELANNIVKNCPGLRGYIGVDFVLSDNGAVVLEINPRLTTSYAGLHQSLHQNPMSWLLGIFQDRRLPELDAVRYSPVQLMLKDL